ncbi:MAG TPA: hypothetical protein VJA18_02290 [Candidatus Nanoarchaeia archaeon]|nr:hypothetical protein [Candidatus Nanoarchaeia archaeon]
MKKIFTLLLVVFFLAGCTPTQYVCPDGSTVENVELCPKPQQPVELKIPPEIEEILAKTSNVKSISYTYRRLDRPTENVLQFWIKGPIVKRELPVQTEVYQKNEMDVVTFNIIDKTATAYCESKKFCIKIGEIGPVDYDQYYIKTPFEWREEIISAEKITEEIIEKRKVWLLKANDDVLMWVDTYYGLPLRVEVGSERHEFEEFVFNAVKDEEVGWVERT